jgi:hypothetical protein
MNSKVIRFSILSTMMTAVTALVVAIWVGGMVQAAQESKPKPAPKPVAPVSPEAQQSKPTAAQPAAQDDEPVALTEKTKRPTVIVQPVLTSDQFANFRPPYINDKGEITVLGLFSFPDAPSKVGQRLVARSLDGKWRVLMAQGETSTDTKVRLESFGLPHVNGNGDVTFVANGPAGPSAPTDPVDSNDPASFRPTVSNQVLYRKSADSVKAVFRMGADVPNMPSYITGISNVSSNAAGTTSFIGTYSEPDGRGLFYVADGKVNLLARSGQKIGQTETGTFSEHYYPSAINDRNEVAFLGRAGDKSGIFVASPKGIDIVAFGGRPSPLKGASFLGFGNRTPAINNRGDVAFIGFFDGPQSGRGIFYKPVGGAIRLLVRSGESIPGTNWNLTDFSGVSLNDQGDLAFSASYAGRSRGVFIRTAKGIEAVALLDQKIPGGEKDEVFNHFTQPDINIRGEVVFYAQWRTPKTGVDVGVFWRDAQGNLKLLFKRGDQMPK